LLSDPETKSFKTHSTPVKNENSPGRFGSVKGGDAQLCGVTGSRCCTKWDYWWCCSAAAVPGRAVSGETDMFTDSRG